MHKNDLTAILTTIVGVGALATDAAFGTYLQTIFGSSANVILAGFGAAGLVAATIARVLGSPSSTS